VKKIENIIIPGKAGKNKGGKTMKKMIGLLCLGFLIFSLPGCALFQKPPSGLDEQKAWIENTKTSLQTSAAGENILYVVFTGLCFEGTIDEKTCTLGSVLDKAWSADLLAANDALDKYARNEITQLEAQRLVDQALVKSLGEVTAMLKKSTMQPVQLKANKARGLDLTVPSGQKK
jgi:hypothetical protein